MEFRLRMDIDSHNGHINVFRHEGTSPVQLFYRQVGEDKGEQETFNTLKQEICISKMSIEKFGECLKNKT
jgi:hypothetical protein